MTVNIWLPTIGQVVVYMVHRWQFQVII